MYQIRCDQYILYDPRHEKLKVNSPKCKLEVNTVGEASFTIYSNHPYYDRLQKMRSVFEIWQDNDIIFRGRMTNDSKDFDNIKLVDLEGVGAYFNDSVVRPFIFPEDHLDESDYNAAATSGNVVKYLLRKGIGAVFFRSQGIVHSLRGSAGFQRLCREDLGNLLVLLVDFVHILQRPFSAGHFNADALVEFYAGKQLDKTDFTGVCHMDAAAGAAVVARYFHNAYRPGQGALGAVKYIG
jgi:hypothetical protein